MLILSQEKRKVVEIPIERIVPNPSQPRRIFVQTELDNLSNSLKESGLLQPLTVRRLGANQYELIAGERRLRACRIAGFKTVSCIVNDCDEKQSAIYAMLENLQRQDLQLFEEAEGIARLISDWGVTQEEAAIRLGKSQSAIANKLRLLKLSDDVKFSLNQKQITERHARAMLSLNEEKQQEVLREVLKKKLTVADTERLIKKEPKPKKKKASADVKKTISRNVKIALNTLQQAIGMIEKTGTSLQQETEDLEDEYVITIRIHK